MGEPQGKHRYDMILGRDILSELKTDLCLFKNTIKGNGRTYYGFTVLIKEISNINCNASSNWVNNEIFWNEYLWKRKDVLDFTQHMYPILDTYYEKFDLSKFTS